MHIHVHKSHGIIKNYKGKSLLIALSLALRFLLYTFVLKIGMCLQGLMKFHQFLKDIKETVYTKAIKNYKGK